MTTTTPKDQVMSPVIASPHALGAKPAPSNLSDQLRASLDTSTCRKMIKTGTEGGKPVSKPCVKPAGHDTDLKDADGKITVKATACSWRTYNRTSLNVTASSLESLEDVPVDTELDRINEPGIRDDIQVQVDAAIKASYDTWVAKGKPAGFDQSIKLGAGVKRYFIEPEQEAAWRKRLQRAADLHGIRVRIVGPKRHEDGRTMLYFIAKDRTQRTARTK